MAFADLIAALLLPLPPLLGFWTFRRTGRAGLGHAYFLGGLLAVLALPWAQLTGVPIPAPQVGAALLGFTLFLQAQREGVQGVRYLALGVGGISLFQVFLLFHLNLPWQEIPRFWFGAALEGLLWLVLSDLAYRWTGGRQLELRMPLVGASALGLGVLAQILLPAGLPRLSWPAALLGGLLLGLVALLQLKWLREQGAWVEGRGQGLRVALALLEKKVETPASSGLALGLDSRQAMWMVDDQGRVLESNGSFSQLVGLPRYRLRGYALDALFQGGETPVWEAVRQQLLQFGCATVHATQVSENGTFRPVSLEASTFDRGMALLWISDSSPGSLVLRGGGGARRPGGDDDGRRLEANASLALASASERLAASAPEGPLHRAAVHAQTASLRLGQFPPPGETVDGRLFLESLLPKLRRMVPLHSELSLRADPLALETDPEALERLAIQLLLHAGDRTGRESLVLALDAVDLGGRSFALLHAEARGTGRSRPRELFGLGWLRQSVREAGGMLELVQETRHVRPRIYLPVAASAHSLAGPLLQGRVLWIVDRDPLVQESLVDRVENLGGQALAFGDLHELLRGSRGEAQPDLLVLERTPRLERFQRALRAFQKEPIPTLVLGMGQPLSLDPAALGLRRLGFLEKPFEPEAFSRAALALLNGSPVVG
ncbi:hypothetical protein [Geothrix sp. 21YS21S-4]|uniref:hypothetical protein n=1 Tax=Geothrix sp. 21YS21S-4 TaxID=3068889 RepID=UPI0027B8DB5D|nr:hypothetical protein [Geothrix sp. 21YS21S-4]